MPATAYYGIQTARAMENFQISGRTLSDYPELINGFAQTKMAAARANTDVGKMTPDVRDAIAWGAHLTTIASGGSNLAESLMWATS